MEHLKLLERHRQKVAFGHALMKLIFMYLCIFVFYITSLYFRNVIEEDVLLSKFENVKVLVQTKDILNHDVSSLSEDIKKTLENTYIYENSEKHLNHINDTISGIDIPFEKIIDTLGYKYYSSQVAPQDSLVSILVRIPSDYLLFEGMVVSLLLLATMPFTYAILAYVSCKAMHRIYAPIREIIENLENFSADINHEFKTSLSEILSSLELATATGDYKETTQRAIRSTRKLDSILDSLSSTLYFTNSEYRKQKINIISFLEKEIQEYEGSWKHKKITVRKLYGVKSKVYAKIDTKALLVCFGNIFSNAIKYSHENGIIEIDIFENGFSIKDYGVGIEAENINKIFERSFRESYIKPGSGIGLSLVKKIVSIYNWKIEVQSEKGTFTQVNVIFL